MSYVFPADPDASESEALMAAAEHMSIMGTVIAQAGLQLGQAMMSVPKMNDVVPVDVIQNNIRMLTAGAAEDLPVPVTVCCYLARVIQGPGVIVRQPDIEKVLEAIEEWSSAPRTYDDLRGLYARGVGLTSDDVTQMGKMLRAVRDRLAVVEE